MDSALQQGAQGVENIFAHLLVRGEAAAMPTSIQQPCPGQAPCTQAFADEALLPFQPQHKSKLVLTDWGLWSAKHMPTEE